MEQLELSKIAEPTMRHLITVVFFAILCPRPAVGDDRPMRLDKPNGTVRVATFNISHHRRRSGDLAKHLSGGRNRQSQQVAEILQIVRPDVVLLNEFDFEESKTAAELFVSLYLTVGQNGKQPISYPHVYSDSVNTGVDSGHDLNNDGKTGGAADCFGFGEHPGQYGMIVLSKFPIDTDRVRTLQNFLWKNMPNAKLPVNSTATSYYSENELAIFRLSSKSHWDIPIVIGGQTVHFLTAHPTPPVFDGPEDRNGRRNHDEIRLFADYIDPKRSAYIYDDTGRRGGLAEDAKFVIAGDYNADPFDGDSSDAAISQFLNHPLIDSSLIPESGGAKEQSDKQGGANETHKGDPRHDTADFGDRGRASGNLRVDYVLPSRNVRTENAGVFWPLTDQDEFELISASDHRLVWIDVAIE